MLSGHNPFECRIMWMLAVFVEQLLIVDVVFVHESPCENEQTQYIKIGKNQNERTVCVFMME